MSCVCVFVGEKSKTLSGLTLAIELGTILDMIQMILHLTVEVIHQLLQIGQFAFVALDRVFQVCREQKVSVACSYREDTQIILTLNLCKFSIDTIQQIVGIVLQRCATSTKIVAFLRFGSDLACRIFVSLQKLVRRLGSN